jgi:iron complex outermembrane receptor protein
MLFKIIVQSGCLTTGNSVAAAEPETINAAMAPIGNRNDERHDNPMRDTSFGDTIAVLVFSLFSGAVYFASDIAAAASLTDMSLEELLKIEVTSVSKRTEHMSDSPAAIFVVTQDDIRRMGATSIPEALRLVPGLQVSRVDRNKWGINARGFNGGFQANKMQVLVDGRSVYTPLFSGVWWDEQDTVMEDIERIEVIRGPGASLWGANAVNGVINIITKQARNTQGGLLSTAAGDEDNAVVALRYGGSAGENTHYRVYGKYFDRDGFVDARGEDAGDNWRQKKTGFRLDHRLTADDGLTLQGDFHEGDVGGALGAAATLRPPYERPASGEQRTRSANVLGRWKRRLSETSDFALQLYYDRSERMTPSLSLDWIIDTADIDFQHSFAVGTRHKVLWGGGYRYLHNDFHSSFEISSDPSERSDHWSNLFIQDEMKLITDRLGLTLGTKLEHRDVVGFMLQPNARLLWTPDDRHTLWVSVARAMRTPSWGEQDSRFNVATQTRPGAPFPALFFWQGSRDTDPEELTAYELGYRSQVLSRLAMDSVLFYHVYDKLIGFQRSPCSLRVTTGIPHLDCPLVFANTLEGETYGVELFADWRPFDAWRLLAGYTLLKTDLRARRPNTRIASITSEVGVDPQHQFFLRSAFDLPHNVQFDVMFRHVDSLPRFRLDSYQTLDLRLAWMPSRNLELAFLGRNLTDDRHFESGELPILTPTAIERDFLAIVRWNF